MKIARRMLVALALVAAFISMAGVGQVSAGHNARITLHVNECSSKTKNLFKACHENRLGGVWFKVTGVERATNNDGVVTWAPGAGTKTVYIDQNTFDLYEGAYVYCSNQVTKKVLFDGRTGTGNFTIKTTAGQPVICDYYLLT